MSNIDVTELKPYSWTLRRSCRKVMRLDSTSASRYLAIVAGVGGKEGGGAGSEQVVIGCVTVCT